MKQCFSALAIILGLLFSCDKNEGDMIVEFPVTVKAVNLVKNGEIRLFIAGEEQFNKSLINRFVDENYFNRQGGPVIGDITFLSADTVIIDSNMKDKYIVKNEGDQFLLYSVRSYVEDVQNYDRFDYILKYQAPLREPTLGGGYLTNAVNVAYGNYHSLEWCVLVYKFSYDRNGSRGLYSGQLSNEFSGDVSFLRAKDTLAIQEYRLIFKK